MTFAQQMEAWAKKTKLKTEEVVTIACTKISTEIMHRTPVDTGYLVGNWIPSTGAPITQKTESRSPNLVGVNYTAKSAAGNVYFFVNNVEYVRDVEYGLYPSPVKFGTPVKNKGFIKFEVRSMNGYSLKAPQGMVRVSIQSFKAGLKEAIK